METTSEEVTIKSETLKSLTDAIQALMQRTATLESLYSKHNAAVGNSGALVEGSFISKNTDEINNGVSNTSFMSRIDSRESKSTSYGDIAEASDWLRGKIKEIIEDHLFNIDFYKVRQGRGKAEDGKNMFAYISGKQLTHVINTVFAGHYSLEARQSTYSSPLMGSLIEISRDERPEQFFTVHEAVLTEPGLQVMEAKYKTFKEMSAEGKRKAVKVAIESNDLLYEKHYGLMTNLETRAPSIVSHKEMMPSLSLTAIVDIIIHYNNIVFRWSGSGQKDSSTMGSEVNQSLSNTITKSAYTDAKKRAFMEMVGDVTCNENINNAVLEYAKEMKAFEDHNKTTLSIIPAPLRSPRTCNDVLVYLLAEQILDYIEAFKTALANNKVTPEQNKAKTVFSSVFAVTYSASTNNGTMYYPIEMSARYLFARHFNVADSAKMEELEKVAQEVKESKRELFEATLKASGGAAIDTFLKSCGIPYHKKMENAEVQYGEMIPVSLNKAARLKLFAALCIYYFNVVSKIREKVMSIFTIEKHNLLSEYARAELEEKRIVSAATRKKRKREQEEGEENPLAEQQEEPDSKKMKLK